jgi:hypothetical protein
MKRVAKPAYALGKLTKRLGPCGNAGLIAGSLTGILLSLLGWEESGSVSLSAEQIVAAIAMIAAFSWVVLLFILITLLRMSPPSVLAPSFVNVLAVVSLTVLSTAAVDGYDFAALIGPVVGMLVGSGLCFLSRVREDPS